ncbi:hypothetical protein ScPMuIL_012723 [Solemya velum]
MAKGTSFFVLFVLFCTHSCKTETVILGDRQYTVSDDLQSWQDALKSCRADGSHLLGAQTPNDTIFAIIDQFLLESRLLHSQTWYDSLPSRSPFAKSVDECADRCKNATSFFKLQDGLCHCVADVSIYNPLYPPLCKLRCEKQSCSNGTMWIYEIADMSKNTWEGGSSGTKECVYITKNDKDEVLLGTWWCGKVYAYLCEIDTSHTSKGHMAIKVPENWDRSWSNCLSMGGWLSRFATTDELTDPGLLSVLEPQTRYWIGLKRQRSTRILTDNKAPPKVEYCESFQVNKNDNKNNGPALCDLKKKFICEKEYMDPSTRNRTDNNTVGDTGGGDIGTPYGSTHRGHTGTLYTQASDDGYETTAPGSDVFDKKSPDNDENDQGYDYLYIGILLVVLVLLTILFLVILLVRQRRKKKRNLLKIRSENEINYKYIPSEQDNDQKSPPKKPLRRNLSKPNYENVIVGPSGNTHITDDKSQPSTVTKPEVGSDIPFIDANLSQTERQKFDRSTSLLSDQLDIIEQEIDNKSNSENSPMNEAVQIHGDRNH